ncbi:hypothetical protein K435DRAFT_829653 [Dendrothele bispora CBS 962.96]|uniref:Methyltransferase domain-containing protein n=1 Tax=Dendrothele bispora (strain CBS 962.96) TaxID=1314807 RepID=A0A4S8LS86_DENBC|nr:hypothetical protein K435DRAFT_829653 [Dendrothele bispora CBS 962.96]
MNSNDPFQPVDLVLTTDETEFFLATLGLDNVDELKMHIINIQKEALEIFSYPCIRRFDFIRFKMTKHPQYKKSIEYMNVNKQAVFLDMGCCFGTDVRKAIADGCPAERIIASDLRQEFWDLGNKLFKSGPETLLSTFIQGDVLDPLFIPGSQQHTTTDSAGLSPTDLKSLTNFSPLVGQTTFIHASDFFHLFTESDQTKVAQQLASLLSRTSGSMIFGSHASRPEKGFRTEHPGTSGPGYLGSRMFCHSPSSWNEMWEGVFPPGTVRVGVKLVERVREEIAATPDVKFYRLVWSVTVL